MNGFRTHQIKYLLIALFIFATAYLFFRPLIVSIDSIQGFLAYKGTIQTGEFNVRAEVSPSDINKDNLFFVSWWSPGQWMFPVFFCYIMHLNLGISAVIVTILSSVAGVFGFYKVFR